MLDQQTIISSGNEAAAHAIIDIGYDGEGYYPITPSSEVGEYVNRAYAQGEVDLSFVVGTSELAAISTVAGMAIAGGRAVDVTSAQGLLLKAEELPALAGLGLPVVLNLATRDVNAPLNIKNGHSDLYAALGWGWIIFLAKMYTVGHKFVPPPIHAGGLRYHGDSPTLCLLYHHKYIEAVAYRQRAVFDAAVQFARVEGIIPAPESAHAIRKAIDEALQCKVEGVSRAILFNLSGHGHFDLQAYDEYTAGKLEDYAYPREQIEASMKELAALQP